MSSRRKKLFGQLWFASIVLTVLSVLALVTQFVQFLDDSPEAIETEMAEYEPEPSKPAPRPAAASRHRQVVHTSGQVLSNSPPQGADDEQSVQAADYTTDKKDEAERQRGAWLNGTIEVDDSDTIQR
ncbi:MAG: hypothetical protein JSS02_11625 [Planctomycetes bacterium]|nr:hypothetical protein [Planctomycetota bacterium]